MTERETSGVRKQDEETLVSDAGDTKAWKQIGQTRASCATIALYQCCSL